LFLSSGYNPLYVNFPALNAGFYVHYQGYYPVPLHPFRLHFMLAFFFVLYVRIPFGLGSAALSSLSGKYHLPLQKFPHSPIEWGIFF